MCDVLIFKMLLTAFSRALGESQKLVCFNGVSGESQKAQEIIAGIREPVFNGEFGKPQKVDDHNDSCGETRKLNEVVEGILAEYCYFFNGSSGELKELGNINGASGKSQKGLGVQRYYRH